ARHLHEPVPLARDGRGDRRVVRRARQRHLLGRGGGRGGGDHHGVGQLARQEASALRVGGLVGDHTLDVAQLGSGAGEQGEAYRQQQLGRDQQVFTARELGEGGGDRAFERVLQRDDRAVRLTPPDGLERRRDAGA